MRRRNTRRNHCERRSLRYYSYKLLTLFVSMPFCPDTLFWGWSTLTLLLCLTTNLFLRDYFLQVFFFSFMSCLPSWFDCSLRTFLKFIFAYLLHASSWTITWNEVSYGFIWYLSFRVLSVVSSVPVLGYMHQTLHLCWKKATQEYAFKLWAWRATTCLSWLDDFMPISAEHMNDEIWIEFWK